MTKYQPHISLLSALVLFSALLMSADCQLGCFKTIRADLENYFFPLQKMISTPIQFAISNIDEWESLFKQHSDVMAQLKKVNEKNIYLLAENQKTRALEIENQNLKALLNVSRSMKAKLLLANLLQVSADSFSHYIILDKGKTEGVSENQAILDTRGVIGLVTRVNDSTSKIRLITDKSHAVPVQNSRNGLRAIASGTGQPDTLVLLHAPLSADYQVGDYLLTSGLGGRFPAGYPLGEVTEVKRLPGQPFARILIKPLADLKKIYQVLIVKETLEKELPEKETVVKEGPLREIPLRQTSVKEMSVKETPIKNNVEPTDVSPPELF